MVTVDTSKQDIAHAVKLDKRGACDSPFCGMPLLFSGVRCLILVTFFQPP
jgi:hypothetical protein